MNSREIASVACAITGIAALFSVTTLIQGLATLPFYSEVVSHMALFVIAWCLPIVLLGLAGVWLLARRREVAEWLVPEATSDSVAVSPEHFQNVAFAVLGLYFVVSSLPDLGSLASVLIDIRSYDSSDQYAAVYRSSVPKFIGTLLKFVIGAHLFFNAHKVSAYLRSRVPEIASNAQNSSKPLEFCPNCGSGFQASDYRPGLETHLCSKCGNTLPRSIFES